MSSSIPAKNTCTYCGNNPTSHVNAWLDSAMFLVTNSLSQRFFETSLGRMLIESTDYFFERMCDALAYAGMLAYETDGSRITIDRAKVLYDEVVRRGGVMEAVLFMGKSIDIYRITLADGRSIFFSGLPRLDAVESAVAGWMDDKAYLKERLARAGVSVSRGAGVSGFNEARRVFENVGGAVIVKPRFGSRGRHTTTHITTLHDLKHAFRVAKKLCHYVVVEEHLEGSVYRATMVNGVLAGVLAGDPPRITGDGTRTIRELIDIKNATRDARVAEVRITDTLSVFLARIGYALDDVLEDGKTIDLTEKIGLSYGGKSREVTPQVHPKLRNELERAAQEVGDSLLGFDFITTDVSVDPDTVRWGIIECNALPFINLHHDPLEGEPVNVAGMLLDHIEAGLGKRCGR